MNCCPNCKRHYPDSIAFCPVDGCRLRPITEGDRFAKRTSNLHNRQVGPYMLEEVLAEGGMGVVFLARHVKLGRKVALKMLRPEFSGNPRAIARFFREARAVNAIQHENIINITDFIEDPRGDNFYVMELLEGQSLKKLNQNAGTLPVPRALGIALQVADAVAAVHRAGIIHRDLKPDNIFLVRKGERVDSVKLLDFGIAKQVQVSDEEDFAQRTSEGTILGTPEYMSPEQAAGQPVDFRTDVYSLGVLLYEMLTGRKPITGRSFSERIFAVISQHPVPPSRIEGLQLCLPHRLESLIMRCLEKDPERRPQSMEELVASLGEIGRAESVQCESPSRDLPAVHERRGSRHPGIRLTGVLLGSLFLIGLGIGAAFLFRSREALSQAAPGPSPPPATPEAVAATPPPAPAGASRVILRFCSTPAGASVRRAGQAEPLGATPLEIAVDSSDRVEAFTLHLAGYAPEQVRLPLDRHGQATVTLKKLPSRPSGPARPPDKPPAGKKPKPQSQDLGGTVDPFADE